jgi:cell division topological specificity factor
MALLDYLLGQKKHKSASMAKDRLQILLAHERGDRRAPEYLPQMREEIMQVIAKYVTVDQEQLQISIDEANGFEVLELNLVLPDEQKSAKS